MEQKFDTAPRAELRLEGRRVSRSDVVNDWGLQLVWSVSRDDQPIATAPARATDTYQHPDVTPGQYAIVLQMFWYGDYRKTSAGEFVNSKFVDVSNVVRYTI